MSPSIILVVEDEPAIAEMLSFTLGQSGYRSILASDAQHAYAEIEKQIPDLILLDWMLPGTSGIDVARYLRGEKNSTNIPIIMLTAKGDEQDIIQGLDAGADDYIVKPFSPKELVARIKSIFRRLPVNDDKHKLQVEGLCMDTQTHRVSVDAKPIDLGPTEYNLLQFFMSHQERVYSRSQILDLVWGENVYIEDRTVDVHIRRLRKILASHGYDQMIQTVRGSGYRFSVQV